MHILSDSTISHIRQSERLLYNATVQVILPPKLGVVRPRVRVLFISNHNKRLWVPDSLGESWQMYNHHDSMNRIDSKFMDMQLVAKIHFSLYPSECFCQTHKSETKFLACHSKRGKDIDWSQKRNPPTSNTLVTASTAPVSQASNPVVSQTPPPSYAVTS